MKKLKYNIIFIDADGTLFDFDKSAKDSLKMTFAFIENNVGKNNSKVEIRFDNEILKKDIFFNYSFDYLFEVYEEGNKEAWKKLEKKLIDIDTLKRTRFKSLFKTIGIDFDPLYANDIYLAYLSNSSKYIKGAKKFLENLKKYKQKNNGFPIYVLLTNGLAEVQHSRINISKIDKYFDFIAISEELGVAKPDKEIFKISIEKMIENKIINQNDIKKIIDKKNMIIIGDSISSDITGGKNFEIDTCLVDFKNKSIVKSDNSKNYMKNQTYKYQENSTNEIIPDYICDNFDCVEKVLEIKL